MSARAPSGKRGADDVGAALVEAACRLLSTEGPEALTTRRIAAEAGTTPMTLYARFGDKDGVEQAVIATGFSRLKRALERAAKRSSEPTAAVLAVARAYRRFAKDNPAFYAAMFQRVGRNVPPSAETHLLGTQTFDVLIGVVGRTLGPDVDDEETEVVARRVWAMCHGIVSLELGGMGVALRSSSAAFDDAIRAVLHGSADEPTTTVPPAPR